MAILTRCNKGLVIGNVGGSNCLGSATGPTTLTKPALANFQLLSGTSGAGGVLATTGAYPNPHGIVAGFFDQLYNVRGFSQAVTFVQWGVNTTGLTEWNATHGPAFVTECVAKGFTPNVIIHDWGGNDAQAGADVNAADDRQDILYDKFRTAFGNGLGIYMPLLTVLPEVAPYTFAGGIPAGKAYGIWDEMLEYCTRPRRNWLYGCCETRANPYNVTSDGAHRVSAAQIALGRVVCDALLDAGVIG